MSLQSIFIIFLFLALPAGIAGFYLPQKYVDYQSGLKFNYKPTFLALTILLIMILAALFIPITTFNLPPIRDETEYTTSPLLIAVTACLINVTIRQLLRVYRLRDEVILVDLGIFIYNRLIIAILSVVINSLLLFNFGDFNLELAFSKILFLTFCISAVLFIISAFLKNATLVPDGLWLPLNTIPWDRIKSYQWKHPKNDKIELAIKSSVEIKLNIPASLQEKVDALFQDHEIEQLAPPIYPKPDWIKAPTAEELAYQEQKKALLAKRPKIPTAPIERRLFGLLIDASLITFTLFIATILDRWAYALGPYGRLVTFAIVIAYLGYCNSSRMKGQTIGQRMVNIAVVDRNYNYLSFGRSLMRAFIFSLPFLFFRWRLPLLNSEPFFTISAAFAGALIVAILYSYIFNGATQQGPHELLVGSYVVKWPPITEAPLPKTPRIHRAVTICLFIFLAVVPTAVAFTQSKEAPSAINLSKYQALENSLLETGEYYLVNVINERAPRFNEAGKLSYGKLHVEVWAKTNCRLNRDYCDELERQIARTILEDDEFIDAYDYMTITITNRVDFGITGTRQERIESTPNLWRQALGI